MGKWAYYNDIDPSCAEWVRGLIKLGYVMDGEVDCRSICEVKPDDVKGFIRVHLFCGIAGWDYALNLAGWPKERPIWTISCPCQPLSGAGLRRGAADERHLWPAVYDLVAESEVPGIVGEQVASADGREWLAGVRADLTSLGFRYAALDTCSPCVNSPNIRQRLYWVADAESNGRWRGEPSAQAGVGPAGLRRLGPAGNSQDGRLVDATRGGQRIVGNAPRSGDKRHLDGAIAADSSLADAASDRTVGDVGSQGGARRARGAEPSGGGTDDGLGHPDGGGQSRLGGRGQGGTSQPSEADRLGDTEGPGLQVGTGIAGDAGPPGRTPARQGPAETGAGAGRLDWHGRSTAILCSDGKYRRVPADDQGKPESSLFPLAPVLSGRVAVRLPDGEAEEIHWYNRRIALSGAGNAINARLAAKFIQAVMGAIDVTD